MCDISLGADYFLTIFLFYFVQSDLFSDEDDGPPTKRSKRDDSSCKAFLGDVLATQIVNVSLRLGWHETSCLSPSPMHALVCPANTNVLQLYTSTSMSKCHTLPHAEQKVLPSV
jgi:hypothetical protein